MAKAVFLDRDGVINRNIEEYVKDPDDFELLPGSLEALKELSSSSYKVVIVTNQSGIGKGLYTEDDFRAVTSKMYGIFASEGIRVDGLYYCPHDPASGCSCRKPRIGMIEQAVKDHNIDVNGSYIVGDKTSDIKAGKDSGLVSILVLTGHGGKDNAYLVSPDFIEINLFKAVRRILSAP